ncbi:hypothetical protein [Flavivirga algicola]|uniref:Lipoprotein n=1 Tax=Flavivirga algicola TaxID=2729136 RepID=A0ABX1RZ05_9FLAO|nr:hypothetical protein [Flavivirga algicola]NMH88797.1 hypothetical protein [Flavivirga algicola]
MKKSVLFFMIAAMLVACNQKSKEVTGTPNLEPEVKVVEPTWPMPEDAATVKLSKTEISEKGELIEGNVTLKGLTLLKDSIFTGDFNDAIPLIVTATITNDDVAKFRDGLGSYEHHVNIDNIGADGIYSFPIELIGYQSGTVSIALSWKWTVATEGCCSIALLAVLAGCNNNAACICTTLAAMAAPGSWCCSIHPKMFRYYWSFYGCTGLSPY